MEKTSQVSSINNAHEVDVLPPHSAFSVGERIEFYSQSHHKWFPGRISYCHAVSNAYDVVLGLSGQRRLQVNPTRLRATIHPDERVELYDPRAGTWTEGTFRRGVHMRRLL